MPIDLICLDADDTLWHNMRFFAAAEAAFVDMLAPFADAGIARERLAEVEVRNLRLYGYGAKSFTLSMIETALELGGAALPVAAVSDILAAGRTLLAHPVELFDGIEDTLRTYGRPRAAGAGDQGRPAASGAEACRIGAGRAVPRHRDRQRQDAGDLCRPVDPLWRGAGAGADGRRFDALGRAAGAGERCLGGLRAAARRLGARGGGDAGGQCAISSAWSGWRNCRDGCGR